MKLNKLTTAVKETDLPWERRVCEPWSVMGKMAEMMGNSILNYISLPLLL